MPGNDAPTTPVAVVQRLAELTLELRRLVGQLAQAEADMVMLRSGPEGADLTESKAFLSAEGPMDIRKHTARVEAGAAEFRAVTAESMIRVLKAKIKAVEIEIDVGRTYGATVRAELATLGYGGDGR